MQSVQIVSLNTSAQKGTVKEPTQTIILNEFGVEGDAHAGNWHRQVSLLGIESYRTMEAKKKGTKLDLGVFAENITTEGLVLHKTAVFDRFEQGDLVLEVTQIGKKCHKGCAIMQQIGDCVMPVEGIFCRVIKGGTLNLGEKLEYRPRVIKAKVITLSDRASQGVYEDKSGPLTQKLLREFLTAGNRHFEINVEVIPDDAALLTQTLEQAKKDACDIIISTGGTGIGPRDITPDVVKPLLDKEIPGIMEHIRTKYGAQKPNALISRSIAGVMGSTLVYVLPGSTKGVNEYMTEITPTLEHSLRMLHGVDNH